MYPNLFENFNISSLKCLNTDKINDDLHCIETQRKSLQSSYYTILYKLIKSQCKSINKEQNNNLNYAGKSKGKIKPTWYFYSRFIPKLCLLVFIIWLKLYWS